MKIIYMMKEGIHLYPPCLSQILSLKQLGCDIEVYHGKTDKHTIKILQENNIKDYDLYRKEIKSRNRIILKIKRWLNYRKESIKILKSQKDAENIIWLGTADSAIAIKDKLKNTKYVLNILELYDNNKFYRKNLAKIVNDAKAIICCEYNRANIMRSWYHLEKTPYVIPNKPYQNKFNQMQVNKEIVDKIKDKKLILYQGMISADRDLVNLAEALKEINSDYWLLLMGRDYNNSISKIISKYKKTIYLGYIPAPEHLLYTRYAYIGIANYDYSCLNNVFCAPNKIYEYTGFKIPVLCNDVPGLHYTIGDSKAGVCVDFNSVSEIKNGIIKIEKNYEEYTRRAINFFESTDIVEYYKKIIKEIGVTKDESNT